MFARLVYESFRRQKRRKLLAGAAITLGVTVATAMIAVATDIGDKINRELRTIGANLVITPQEDSLDLEIGGVNLKPPTDGAFLNEADLPKIKGTFWLIASGEMSSCTIRTFLLNRGGMPKCMIQFNRAPISTITSASCSAWLRAAPTDSG